VKLIAIGELIQIEEATDRASRQGIRPFPDYDATYTVMDVDETSILITSDFTSCWVIVRDAAIRFTRTKRGI
jgi:hypothetical protein